MKVVTSVFLLVLAVTTVLPANSQADPFTFLQAGFTQELWGVNSGFLGGVAFAPDGDVLSDPCSGSNGSLYRWDTQTTQIVNATSIHPQVAGSPMPSSVGCGLSNHPNGTLYSNTFGGVVQVDVNTGGPMNSGGAAGNALGIAFHPLAPNDLYYVGGGGSILKIDAALTASSVFSNVTNGDFLDGIAWDPTGEFLLISNRTAAPNYRLTILRNDGTLVQHVQMPVEPDGIAFNTGQGFVVTNNLDGTMTRFDFPANDYTAVPVQSVFASGGFRGDLSKTHSDGCIYLTQNGTRYDDGTVTGENSIVRICGDFDPVQTVDDKTWGRLKATYR
jgi:WD40 repeat protein